MGKYHIFQEITEFAPKILKMGEIYTDSEMCWLEALGLVGGGYRPGEGVFGIKRTPPPFAH